MFISPEFHLYCATRKQTVCLFFFIVCVGGSFVFVAVVGPNLHGAQGLTPEVSSGLFTPDQSRGVPVTDPMLASYKASKLLR